MSRRTKIVMAAIVLLLLLLLGVLLFLRPFANTPGVPEVLGGPPTNSKTSLPVNYSAGSFNANVSVPVNKPAPVVPQKPDDRSTLKIIARTFAEMYGSFSTEGNYQNIIDAEFYMTDAFKTRSDEFVAAERKKPLTGVFAGTTTRALFEPQISALNAAAGTATVTVKTQRHDAGSTAGTEKVYYQDLKLQFIKTGDSWKIDDATWLPI